MLKKLYSILCGSRELVVYLFFGILTTGVNYLIYYPCYNLLHYSAGISNIIAWTGAVCVAFVTNKVFVFKSDDWSAGTVWSEAIKFVSGRVLSGIIETAFLIILVDGLNWNGNLMKVLLGFAVVIGNYVISKWFVFRKNRKF